MIIQWGVIKKGNNLSPGTEWSFNISMPLSFSNYDYSITFGSSNNNNTDYSSGEEIYAIKQSNFRTLKARFFNRNAYSDSYEPCVNWIAIGY